MSRRPFPLLAAFVGLVVVVSSVLSTGASSAAVASSLFITPGPVPTGVRAGTPQTVFEFVRAGSPTGSPVVGQAVHLGVTSGPDVGQSSVVETNSSGEVVWRFGTDEARLDGGTDVVTAYVDSDGDGRLGSGEPSNSTTYFILPTQNRPPTAGPVEVEIPQDLPSPIPLGGSDPDGTIVGYAMVTKPLHGSVPDVLSGAFVRYVPDPGFVGKDSFIYRVTDGDGASADGRVDITVRAETPPPAPVASFDVSPLPPAGPAPLKVSVTDTSTVEGPTAITGRHWVFGDGSSVDGPKAEHIYAKAGSYRLELQITDTFTRVVMASRVIDVGQAVVPPKVPTCMGKPATIVVPAGKVTAFGTPGPDVIVVTGTGAAVYGLGGDDVMCADKGSNTVYGGAGEDRIGIGGDGNVVYSGDDDDQINASGNANRLYGGNGNDHITVGNGAHNELYGGNGDDVLVVGKGFNTLVGGDGNDHLVAGAPGDDLWGGNGDDVVEAPKR